MGKNRKDYKIKHNNVTSKFQKGESYLVDDLIKEHPIRKGIYAREALVSLIGYQYVYIHPNPSMQKVPYESFLDAYNKLYRKGNTTLEEVNNGVKSELDSK